MTLRQQSFVLTGTLISKLASIVNYGDAITERAIADARGTASVNSVDLAMLRKLTRDREVQDWIATLGTHIRVRHRPRPH